MYSGQRQIPRCGTLNHRTRRANSNYDHTALTVFSEIYGKQHKGKQTLRSDFKMKHKASPKTRRGNASCHDAQWRGYTVKKCRSRCSKKWQANKKNYDWQAKHRSFRVVESVHLYNLPRKPDLSRKSYKSWSGPYRVTAKALELKYEALGKNDRKQVVHVNWMKPAYGANTQE